ncbi:MAG: indole-3-glycerol phosphate synthase TrpC [Desulfobulbaceae bacterium]|nr:indole-3-glycerol phosphate synthase TrpC [Desulfobulbaceae bacterium]
MSNTILDTIVAKKHEEIAQLRRQGLPTKKEVDPPRGFIRALQSKSGVAIIAEAKKASPSKGLIEPNFDPVQVAENYERNGAAAISVLTDRHFFQGELDFLSRIRAHVALPVLRKDFIIDPLQIEEAHVAGADAILLIAAILSPALLRDFRLQAESMGMDVLVEVHNEAELEQALSSEARLIGINNRNLHDFSVDLGTTFRLKALMPAGIPVVSESGIATMEDMRRLKEAGIDAALIGESLMRAGSKGTLLQEFTAV